MKKLSVALFFLLMLFAGFAQANTENDGKYPVVQGDYLVKIANKFPGVHWRDIAKANNIKKPWTIYPGQRLVIPTVEAVEISHADEQFLWSNPGNDKYTGTLDAALTLLAYPEPVAKLLKEEVEQNQPQLHVIRRNDTILAMTFGDQLMRKNVVAAWKQPSSYGAAKYQVTYEGEIYTLIRPYICNNWSRLENTEAPPPKAKPKYTYTEPIGSVGPQPRSKLIFLLTLKRVPKKDPQCTRRIGHGPKHLWHMRRCRY